MQHPLRRAAALPAALLAAALAALSPAAAAEPADVRVDAGRRFQTMTGWEVSARVWEYDKRADRYDPSWERDAGEILDALAGDLGITRIRLQLRSGSENPVDHWARFTAGEIGYEAVKAHFYEKINDNADPRVADPAGFQFSNLDHQVEKILLPLRQRVEARGGRLFVNLCYVDFRWTKLKGDVSHARAPEEYAELVTEAFRHLKARWGVVPDTLEVILEPDNSDHWRGREIGLGAVAALARLRDAGFAPKLILPSTAAATKAPEYFDAALKVPGVRENLFSLAYHRYDGARAAAALPAIRARAAAAGIPAEMLEHTAGDWRVLHEDLTVAQAAGWQLYSIAGPRAPGETRVSQSVLLYVEQGKGPGRVRLSHQGRYLAQYFRHVRPGAERIAADTAAPGLFPVAFLNPDGGEVVVIGAGRAGEIRVAGLAPGAYGLFYTTAEETGRVLPPVRLAPGETLAVTLPAPGVVTIHALPR